EVDRLEVEVQQCMELTNTNRSRAYPKTPRKVKQGVEADAEYFSGTPIPHRVMLRISNTRKFRFVSSFQ
ncbi:hypothetical protein C169_28780, partial [Paenibacillus sp. FSL R5-808]